MHPSSGSGTSGTTIAKCLGGHYALSVDLLYEVCVYIETVIRTNVDPPLKIYYRRSRRYGVVSLYMLR